MLENQFIKKLQEKPESVKHMIMWTATLFIMVLIFTFWVWNFSNEISRSNSAAEVPAPENISQLPSAWQSLKSQFENLTRLFSK